MVARCALSTEYYDSFLELHIEQGPLLEREAGRDCFLIVHQHTAQTTQTPQPPPPPCF